MRKKGIKIKRSHRNLYRRRKSTGRKIFETVLLLVIVAALVFVGYSVAPPLLKFFSERSSDNTQSSEPVWTPPESVSSDDSGTDSSSAETSAANTTTKPEEEKPKEEAPVNAVTAPVTALASQNALEAYLDEAVKNGYDTVVFNLKNSNGNLLYKSSVAAVKDNTYIIKGTLTAGQIVKACKAKGIVPMAAISTLCDHIISDVIEGSGYIVPSGPWTWHDAAVKDGGRPWASPYASVTVNYLSDLSGELAKAGFDSVILQNTIFPKFGSYDYSLLPAYLQEAARSEKLAEVAASCAAKVKQSGSKTLVQIDAAQLLTINTSDYKQSAEIWLSRDKMKDCDVLITFDTSTLGKNLQLTEKTAITVDTSIDKAIAQVYAKVKTAANGYNIKVGITNSSNLSQADITAAKAAFEKLGYTAVIIG